MRLNSWAKTKFIKKKSDKTNGIHEPWNFGEGYIQLLWGLTSNARQEAAGMHQLFSRNIKSGFSDLSLHQGQQRAKDV